MRCGWRAEPSLRSASARNWELAIGQIRRRCRGATLSNCELLIATERSSALLPLEHLAYPRRGVGGEQPAPGGMLIAEPLEPVEVDDQEGEDHEHERHDRQDL